MAHPPSRVVQGSSSGGDGPELQSDGKRASALSLVARGDLPRETLTGDVGAQLRGELTGLWAASSALAPELRGRLERAIGLGERVVELADADHAARLAAEHAGAVARAEAAAALQAKDAVLALLGHELRNPLSPILTALELIRLRGDGALRREHEMIERQVTHLLRLVDDLLDFARVSRGELSLRRELCELSEVVVRAVEQASPLLEERRHHLELDVPPTGLVVDVDCARLVQVVSNLLTNAAKYTPVGGRIRVTARIEGAEVILRVRDNGDGIPAEMLGQLFGSFVQGPRTIDRAEGGLGLGLALVRMLTERHGGTVSASSPGSGQGSEFVVRLPGAGALPAQRSSQPCSGPGSTCRVLVVDDNRDAADLLAEALVDMGYEVEVAYDGPSALTVAAGFHPDVGLLDIGLPVMDGFELAQRLRAQHPAVRLAAVTGYGQESDRKRSLQAGIERHLIKPIDLDTLQKLLQELAQPTARASGSTSL